MASSPLRTLILTTLAMVAFATNSLLGRAALVGTTIDPASFSLLRLVSGALVLCIILSVVARTPLRSGGRVAGSMAEGVFLAAYALPFSFAYRSLTTGTGALVLFGVVQATMIGVGLAKGERPTLLRWTGMFAAIAGLVALVLPGLSAPDPLGAALMALSGLAWGLYSLRGKGAKSPLAVSAGNFLRATLLCLVACLALLPLSHDFTVDRRGISLAVTSGALTSGVGYAIWYAALPSLRATTAAIVQLTVPIIAAALGVLFLDEDVSTRLLISSLLVLGGVALTLVPKKSLGIEENTDGLE
jgi:drug/metabolite transporter (DMT)-like permease